MNYLVVGRLSHDQRDYEPGAIVKLDQKIGSLLAALGVVKLETEGETMPDGDEPVASEDKPKQRARAK